jgi:hypothetical protein
MARIAQDRDDFARCRDHLEHAVAVLRTVPTGIGCSAGRWSIWPTSGGARVNTRRPGRR